MLLTMTCSFIVLACKSCLRAVGRGRVCHPLFYDFRAWLLVSCADAIEALKTLTPADIAVVRVMLKPPAGVKLVVEAVAIMLKVQPVKVMATDGVTARWDYWEPAKKTLLNDPVAQRSWLANYLPSDTFSIQNAVILTRSTVWPLLIDPQVCATQIGDSRIQSIA